MERDAVSGPARRFAPDDMLQPLRQGRTRRPVAVCS
jgi:hypothetical protein